MPALPHPGLPAGPLSSKLSPPQSQARQVPRQAVVRRMAEAGGVKLVLVRAPAGFGKTTAMVQAREQLAASGVATAWLTLERTDNDVPRFLACLQQATADPAMAHLYLAAAAFLGAWWRRQPAATGDGG